MRNMLQRFLYGRYGNDQFGKFLTWAALALLILDMFFDLILFELAGELIIVYALFRMLSRNTYARRDENARFLKKSEPVRRWLRLQRTIRQDKDHRYFKCPSCAQQLRVPRGKGRITVTCRSCGAQFEENS